jgi:hypothetical protein
MKLGHVAAIALMGWQLIIPTSVPQPGAANAESTPVVSIWGTYNTRQECVQEQERFVEDPVIGPRMKAGQCIRVPKDDSRTQPPD